MIVEIAGRPANHVQEYLKAHISQIKNLKGICHISEKISEPKLIETEKEIYTCFAEVEFEAEDFLKLTEMVFDFMPSSIEIIKPSNISFNLGDATAYLNNLAGRLHRYDEVAKIAQLQNNQLAQKLQALQQELKNKEEQKPEKKTREKSKKKSKKK